MSGNPSDQDGAGVDIMRLSMNVKRNMLKEKEANGENNDNENYHTKEQSAHKAA